jgi:1,4-dihydroxy-2-naphthoate octaprenyltransferase
MQSKDTPKNDTDPTSLASRATTESAQASEAATNALEKQQTVSGMQPEITVHSVASTSSVTRPAPLVDQPPEHERSLSDWLSIWWDGIRPGYLPLSVLPVILGSVVAWTQSVSPQLPRGDFHPLRFVITLAAVLLLQIGAQLINDYYDYLRGIDISNSLGPGGLIQQGLIEPERVLLIGLVALGVGALLGAFIALSSGWLILIFGLMGICAAYFYSGVPKALSSLALGDLLFFFIFGPLLTLGSYVAQTGHLDRIAYIYSISLGLLAAAFIQVNDMRDVASDTQAGKLTVASLLGARVSRVLYVMLVLGAYVPIVAMGLPSHSPHLLLLVLWTLPIVVIAITTVLRTASSASLHVAMFQTLKLEAFFTILLIIALTITAFMPLVPHLPSFGLTL